MIEWAEEKGLLKKTIEEKQRGTMGYNEMNKARNEKYISLDLTLKQLQATSTEGSFSEAAEADTTEQAEEKRKENEPSLEGKRANGSPY